MSQDSRPQQDLPALAQQIVRRAKELGRPVVPKGSTAGSVLGGAVGARMETPADLTRKVDRLVSIAPEQPAPYRQALQHLRSRRTDDRASWFAYELVEEAFWRVAKHRPPTRQDDI